MQLYFPTKKTNQIQIENNIYKIFDYNERDEKVCNYGLFRTTNIEIYLIQNGFKYDTIDIYSRDDDDETKMSSLIEYSRKITTNQKTYFIEQKIELYTKYCKSLEQQFIYSFNLYNDLIKINVKNTEFSYSNICIEAPKKYKQSDREDYILKHLSLNLEIFKNFEIIE